MHPELDQLDFATLQERFEGLPTEGDQYARAYYEEVAVRIRNVGGEAGIRYLMNWASRAESIRLQAIFLALTMPPPVDRPDVRSLLKSHLVNPDGGIAAAAVDALAHLPASAVRDEMLHLRRDERPQVRGAVLRYLARNDGPMAIPTLIEALSDPHPIVRECAIDQLDALDAVDALSGVRKLAADSNPDVREAAETFMQNRGRG
jgi:HEAT repeat protein